MRLLNIFKWHTDKTERGSLQKFLKTQYKKTTINITQFYITFASFKITYVPQFSWNRRVCMAWSRGAGRPGESRQSTTSWPDCCTLGCTRVRSLERHRTSRPCDSGWLISSFCWIEKVLVLVNFKLLINRYRVFRKNYVFSQFTATPPSPTSL